MLQNAYFLAKIGADTAENEQHFAEILPIGRRVADRCRSEVGLLSQLAPSAPVVPQQRLHLLGGRRFGAESKKLEKSGGCHREKTQCRRTAFRGNRWRAADFDACG